MPPLLPPGRRLPEPDRMLMEILAGARGTVPGTTRHRRADVIGLLVAATVVAVAMTMAAAPLVLPHADDIVTAPSKVTGLPTASTAPTPPTPGPQDPPTGRLALGESHRFAHVTVSVARIDRHPMFGVLIEAEVCVRSLPPHPTGTTTRVSWDAWTVATGEDRTEASLRQAPVPPPEHLYPRQRFLQVGECARGWIPFNIDEHSDVVAVLYANSLGDTAAWASQ